MFSSYLENLAQIISDSKPHGNQSELDDLPKDSRRPLNIDEVVVDGD